MRDTSDKIRMEVSRKMEMRNMLMSAPAEVTEMPKKSTKKKAVTVILVAEIVSALGLSVYAAIKGLESQTFGKSSWGPSIEEDIKNSVPPREFISLVGYNDSPEYKATEEWLKFESSYDRDWKILNEAEAETRRTHKDPFGEKYPGYNIYSQEMADKLEEIIAKYNLKLHSGPLDCDEKILKEKEGIDVFFSSASGGGYMYDGGSFSLDSTYNGMHFQLGRRMRGYFDNTYLNIGNKQEYEEWTYKTKSGVTVNIAYNNKGGEFKKAIISVSLEKSFVSVNVLPWNDDLELNNLTKADIEKLADEINFSQLG